MNTTLPASNLTFAPKPVAKKGTYFVQTWGCQMNEEDSEQLGLALEQLGYQSVSSILEAQVIVLNTCSVRKKPEDKAFSMLGELALLKKSRPDMIIGVCGCMAQIRADEIHRRAPHVDFVLGTGDLSQIGGLVEQAAQTRKFAKRLDLPERKGAVVTDVPQRNLERATKIKSFVPIQYGCDKFCAFCIVPSTRGRERSRPTDHIVEEVTKLAELGTREVTLLGQTVNSYGKNLLEGRVPFSELLRKVAEVEGLQRIRYTSPYPRDFRQDLIDTIRDCPKVMEHCHMPLQAGDDETLQRMKRLYSVESYLEIVRNLRQSIPGIGLTTDIIVGFPGESDKQFENTLKVVEEVRFDGAYMFIYSTRPGTPAAEMEQVPVQVKKERMLRLTQVQNRITCEINETYVGKTLEVLIEGPSPKNKKVLQGFSREYKMVHFEGSPDRIGRIAKVKVEKAFLWGFAGTLV